MAVQRLSRTLGVLMLAALVSGCAADPSVEPTPTPTFANEDEAFAAAEATYRAYVDALNQVDLADPATFEEVYAWTTGEANASAREYLSQLHSEEVKLLGSSRVARIWSELGDQPTIVSVCLDVSEVELLDVNGRSIVDANRPNEQSFKVKLQSSRYAAHGLLISEFEGGDESLCAQ